MANKMTYVMALEVAIASVSDAEVREKLEALKASHEKKNHAERGLTPTQKQNIDHKTSILDFMQIGEKYTVTDITKGVFGNELTPQRVSALMRQLKEAELVTRVEIKRKAYFYKNEI